MKRKKDTRELSEYLHDNLEKDVSLYQGVVHERPAHKGVVLTLNPDGGGVSKTYLVFGDKLVTVP